MKLALMMLTATLTSLPAGAENLALAFDGSSQYARLEEGNGLDLSTGTIELWARIDRLYDEQCLVVRADGIATISYGLMYDTASVAEPNRINGFVNANGVWGSTVRMVGGPTSTPPQRWVHSAMTFDAAAQELKFYADGRFTRGTNFADATVFNSSRLNIGGGHPGWTYFAGEMDELRIWNVVRTEQEIAADMYRELSGTESNLVAYYNFNAGGGTVLPDISGHSNDATLVSMSTGNWVRSSAFGPVQELTRTGDAMEVRWRSDTNLPYRVEAADPALTNWTAVGDVTIGTGTSVVSTLSITNDGPWFFRLRETRAHD
jgi:hypothetical protein